MTPFLDSVLKLAPRVAAFDCDGTLWSGDVGEGFFDWELNQKNVVSDALERSMRARYVDYRAGNVAEDQMCGEMVTMHKGISESVMMRAAAEYFDHAFPGKIFPRMRELIRRLHEAGCEVWAPSGPGKPRALREVVKKEIDAAFGNARWDTEMLAMAKHAFAVNPNPDLEATALQRGWTIYFPDGTHHR